MSSSVFLPEVHLLSAFPLWPLQHASCDRHSLQRGSEFIWRLTGSGLSLWPLVVTQALPLKLLFLSTHAPFLSKGLSAVSLAVCSYLMANMLWNFGFFSPFSPHRVLRFFSCNDPLRIHYLVFVALDESINNRVCLHNPFTWSQQQNRIIEMHFFN